MNLNNYASPEASKRLADAGIVLETEAVWYKFPDTDWKLGRIGYEIDKYSIHIPAPSMAEVWRELPTGTRMIKGNDTYEVWLTEKPLASCINVNPTDALIDLLIHTY